MKKALISLAIAQVFIGFATRSVADDQYTPDGKPRSGHFEISIYDLPTGSSSSPELLGQAIKKHNTTQLSSPQIQQRSSQPQNRKKSEISKIRLPEYYIQDVENASFEGRIDQSREVVDYSHLKLKPLNLKSVSGCILKSTQLNGIKRGNLNTGFSRYYTCSDGDIYTRDMLLEGVRLTTIKEQSNVDIKGNSGTIYAVRDSSGRSYTSLSWVSNNTAHMIQKVGTGVSTRDWLYRYAEELTSASY